MLYLDMDGVLADFDAGYERAFGVRLDRREYVVDGIDRVDWQRMALTSNFFLELPPMPDLWELWRGISSLSPTILSASPSIVADATENKKEWIRRHLGTVPSIFVSNAERKAEYCRPGDVLVDDYPKYRHSWERAGGRFILHRSARETLRELAVER